MFQLEFLQLLLIFFAGMFSSAFVTFLLVRSDYLWVIRRLWEYIERQQHSEEMGNISLLLQRYRLLREEEEGHPSSPEDEDDEEEGGTGDNIDFWKH